MGIFRYFVTWLRFAQGPKKEIFKIFKTLHFIINVSHLQMLLDRSASNNNIFLDIFSSINETVVYFFSFRSSKHNENEANEENSNSAPLYPLPLLRERTLRENASSTFVRQLQQFHAPPEKRKRTYIHQFQHETHTIVHCRRTY